MQRTRTAGLTQSTRHLDHDAVVGEEEIDTLDMPTVPALHGLGHGPRQATSTHGLQEPAFEHGFATEADGTVDRCLQSPLHRACRGQVEDRAGRRRATESVDRDDVERGHRARRVNGS